MTIPTTVYYCSFEFELAAYTGNISIGLEKIWTHHQIYPYNACLLHLCEYYSLSVDFLTYWGQIVNQFQIIVMGHLVSFM